MLTPPTPAVASMVPSGLNARDPVEPVAIGPSTRCRVRTSQMTTSPGASEEEPDAPAVIGRVDRAAATLEPSGLKATASTFWAVNGAPIAVLSWTSHSLKPAAPPEARMRWSGLSASGPFTSDKVDGEAKKVARLRHVLDSPEQRVPRLKGRLHLPRRDGEQEGAIRSVIERAKGAGCEQLGQGGTRLVLRDLPFLPSVTAFNEGDAAQDQRDDESHGYDRHGPSQASGRLPPRGEDVGGVLLGRASSGAPGLAEPLLGAREISATKQQGLVTAGGLPLVRANQEAGVRMRPVGIHQQRLGQGVERMLERLRLGEVDPVVDHDRLRYQALVDLSQQDRHHPLVCSSRVSGFLAAHRRLHRVR